MLCVGQGWAQDNTPLHIKVTKAGTLKKQLDVSTSDVTATEVKISGPIDCYDIRTIRELCGSDEYSGKYPHANVRSIDLSDVTFVGGSDPTFFYIMEYDRKEGIDKKYIIKEGEEKMLPERMFYNCISIEKIILPKTITSIGFGAFGYCINLKEIEIPDQVTSIKSTAFGLCSALEHIKLPKQLTEIEAYAFYFCKSLKEITIPDGVKVIKAQTFFETPALRTINLPETMTSFDKEAFTNARGLKQITIPKGIRAIPENCFMQCDNLETVNFSSDVKSIESNAFQFCRGLKTLNFVEGLVTIGHQAFIECTAIKELHFPNSLQYIKQEAFKTTSPSDTREIIFGSGLLQIGDQAFFKKTSIKKIKLPDEVKLIDYSAFAECSSLEEIDLGLATPELVQNPFLVCRALKKFIVDPKNTDYMVYQDVLYTADGTKLISFPNMSGKSLVMHPKTQQFEDFAFHSCHNLESVVFSPEFAEFGARPFCDCINLKHIQVFNSTPVEYPGPYEAFESVDVANCTLVVPEGSENSYRNSNTWGAFKIRIDNAVSPIESTRSSIVCQVVEDALTIKALSVAEGKAFLYSSNGDAVATAPVKEGCASIHIGTMPEGSYVLVVRSTDGTVSSTKIIL